MADPLIARYRHYLERARRLRPHVLSEPEEQVLEAKANTAERAFSRLFDEITARARFPVSRRGETAALTEAETLALLHDPDRDVRRAAAEGLTEGLRRDGHLHAFVFNTLIADHASIDRLRRFPDPMASRHLDNETTGRSSRRCSAPASGGTISSPGTTGSRGVSWDTTRSSTTTGTPPRRGRRPRALGRCEGDRSGRVLRLLRRVGRHRAPILRRPLD